MPQMVGQKRKRNTRFSRKGKLQGRMAVARNININKDIHFFKRWTTPGSVTGAVGNSPYLTSATTSLSAIVGVSDFTNLFDQFRITHWQLRFYLKVDPSAQAAASAIYPKLYTCTDFDDSTVPATLNELRERTKTKVAVLNPNRPVIINVKPAVLTLAYRTAVLSSYQPKWKQWLDMGAPDVPHYGLKWALDNFTNTNYTVDVEQRLWFQCRNTR